MVSNGLLNYHQLWLFLQRVMKPFSKIVQRTTTQIYWHQTNHLEWRHKLLQQAHIVSTLHNNVGLYTQSLEVKKSPAAPPQNNTENACFEGSIFFSILRKPQWTIHFFSDGIIREVCFIVVEDILWGYSIKLFVKVVEVFGNAFCSNLYPWSL